MAANLKSLSHTHQAIMDYMMANPSIALGDVASHFGYTQPWLSQIIHSDAFQAMLKDKQGMAFHHTILPIREKMVAIAHQALDKTARLLEQETELRTANDVAESMLDRLGYGAKPMAPGGMNLTINQQNNMIVPNSNAEEIARARAAMQKVSSLGVQVNDVALPLALPREGSASVGTLIEQATVSPSSRENQTYEGRVEIREESP